MAKKRGAYKSEKRRKEVARVKKREEKRKKRMQKKDVASQDTEVAENASVETQDPQ